MVNKLAEFTVKKAKIKSKAGIYEGIVSSIVNFLIFIVKLIIGYFIKSISLITDAFHSLSDVFSSLVIILGFWYSTKPPDEEHPFGHGRVEYITGLIVVVILFIIAFEFAKDSIIRIIHPEEIKFSIGCLIIVGLTGVIKEILSRYSLKIAELVNSSTIEVDAYHHKTDVYATLLVIFSIILSKFGLKRIDGVIGFIISIYIGFIAYKMAKETISPLIGEKPPKDMIEQIKKIALSKEKVQGIHDIIIHSYGDKFIISFHIEVPDYLKSTEIHDIADEIEKKIGAKFNATCIVHQDPINTDHPYFFKIKKFLDENLKNNYHDLKLIGSEEKFNVIFDISVRDYKLISEIKRKLKENFKEINDVIIKIEPEYSYQ